MGSGYTILSNHNVLDIKVQIFVLELKTMPRGKKKGGQSQNQEAELKNLRAQVKALKTEKAKKKQKKRPKRKLKKKKKRRLKKKQRKKLKKKPMQGRPSPPS